MSFSTNSQTFDENDYCKFIYEQQVKEIHRYKIVYHYMNSFIELSISTIGASYFILEAICDFKSNKNDIGALKIVLAILCTLRLMKNIIEHYTKFPQVIHKVPTIQRILRQPKDFDIITNANITINNIPTEPESKNIYTRILELIQKKIITMDEVVNSINETNKNVITGFAHMASRFLNVENRLENVENQLIKMNSMLEIICAHLNIQIPT